MALQLNLLHEEIAEHRQRQRDPLKIGTLVLVALGVLMALFYMWKGYQTLEIKHRLAAVQADWAKVEPKVTSAQKRSAELTGIINTTKTLDSMIDGRFYWGPFLQKLSRSVAPNAQLTNFDGTYSDDTKLVSITIDGIAAGREPRSAAEELRQLLLEQLSEIYGNVAVEFKTLEDLDNIVNVADANMSTARFALGIKFTPTKGELPKPGGTAAPARAPKK
ncbi:MAG: PilN domain-containing protein [Chthoniobacterales bacterium]